MQPEELKKENTNGGGNNAKDEDIPEEVMLTKTLH